MKQNKKYVLDFVISRLNEELQIKQKQKCLSRKRKKANEFLSFLSFFLEKKNIS